MTRKCTRLEREIMLLALKYDPLTLRTVIVNVGGTAQCLRDAMRRLHNGGYLVLMNEQQDKTENHAHEWMLTIDGIELAYDLRDATSRKKAA